MMFDCPICKRIHSVPDDYDNKEFICQNTDQHEFQEMVPEDLYSKTMFTLNTRSTRVNEFRSATIIIHGPDYRRNGERIGTLQGKNW